MEIIKKPDIYLRTKVSENICNTLLQFNEIRKCWKIKDMITFNLFPIPEVIYVTFKYAKLLEYYSSRA